MTCKIIMTSPYPQMTRTIQQVSEELGIPVKIVEDTMSGAAKKVARLAKEGDFEVVVSRAGTAQSIVETVDLPVVHCDNSDFDIMQAFIRARKLGDKIAFLTYPEEAFPYKMKTVSDVIGFEVEQLHYQNLEELMEQIKYASRAKFDVIVGGGRIAFEEVQKYGMKSMHILTSPRTIRRAIIRANEVAQYRIAAREKAERLNAVIHTSEEGILFLNQKGEIEMMNKAAERLFDIDAASVIGFSREKIHNGKLGSLLNRDEIYDRSGSITTDEMVVTYEPVNVGPQRIGTVLSCREISRIQQLETKIRQELHTKGLVARSTFSDIIMRSEKMKDLLQRARYFAQADSTILITGDSGTGKELIAQAIHNASERKDGPFVALNCAALPESLLESELFGYADGAFTGARKGGRTGVFELAHGGTIFLDEIGEISKSIQARLLRVLQEREVMRVGGDRVIPVDIRIIAATNQNLWKQVKEGNFRSDLYFRIHVLRIKVPSLRERKEDIPELVNHFLSQGGSSLRWEQLSSKMRDFLMDYDWPGNVRQLENIVERYRLSVIHPKDENDFIEDVLKETELFQEPDERITEDSLNIQMGTMEDIERQVYEQMLKRYDQNRTLVAEILGISRTTLWKKLNGKKEVGC